MIKNQKGFTLVEILTVVAIISILVVLLVPNLSGVTNNSNVGSVETDMRTIQQNIQQFYIDNRNVKFTEDKVYKYMDTSFERYSADGSNFLKFKTIHQEDPWGNPYHLYVNNEGTPYTMIHSYGPNEKEDIKGNEFGDDIVYLFYPEAN